MRRTLRNASGAPSSGPAPTASLMTLPRCASALALTPGDLSELRCMSSARHTMPQGAGVATLSGDVFSPGGPEAMGVCPPTEAPSEGGRVTQVPGAVAEDVRRPWRSTNCWA